MVRVKVCCISSREELEMAVAAGADGVGLVVGMKSGPGVISEALITDLASRTPPGVSRFLLSPETEARTLAEQSVRLGVDVIQVCDHVEPGVLQDLRRQVSARVVAVVHAFHEDAYGYAVRAAEHAHALLLDSGMPGTSFAELGGTGRTHDWVLSRRIVEDVSVPVWLAGGLNADNVFEAIETVQPFGVDLCTGVRTDGHLDERKLSAFMAEVARAS